MFSACVDLVSYKSSQTGLYELVTRMYYLFTPAGKVLQQTKGVDSIYRDMKNAASFI